LAKSRIVGSTPVCFTDDKDGNTTFLLDKLEDTKTEGLTDKVVNFITIKQIISTLGVQERQVMVLRYLRQYTQCKIAKLLGISQVQVSRIESKVLKQIRQKL